MSVRKKVFLGLLVVFFLIQFIRPEKNVSAAPAPNDLFANYQAPDSVERLIKTACYDCHSNNTVYPWYGEVQPVAWWLNDHVQEGKNELNFSEFATYAPKKGDHKLEEVIEMVEKEEMPLKSYSLIHRNARLSDTQRKTMADWAKGIRKEMQSDVKKAY